MQSKANNATNTINIEEIFFIMNFIALEREFFKGVPLDPTLGGEETAQSPKPAVSSPPNLRPIGRASCLQLVAFRQWRRKPEPWKAGDA